MGKRSRKNRRNNPSQERESEKPKGSEDDRVEQSGMSRSLRREMKRRQDSGERMQRPTKRSRTRPVQFVKEVRAELGRVAWPTRGEVVTYTIVVLISVAFFMSVIYGMDFAFTKGVFWLLNLNK